MEEFIDDFCYTLARIIEIEERGEETNEKAKENTIKNNTIHNLLAECGQA